MDERIETGLREHFEAFKAATAADGGRLGFKIAFNPPAVQQKLGLPYSLVAGLRKGRLHPGGPHSLAGGTRVVLEAEVAVELGAPVASDAGATAAAAAIAKIMPAIEVVDFDRPFEELTDILREGVFQRTVAFGEPVAPPNNKRVDGVIATVHHNQAQIAELDAELATGELPALLLHVARVIEPYGVRLAAGDRLILGSMAPAVLPKPGDRFTLSLGPLGSVSLAFEA